MSILQNIVDKTRSKLVERKAELTLSQIKISLQGLNLPKSRFKEKLAYKSEAIIAEIKKASPSAGVIVENFDPVDSKSIADLQKTLNANGYDLEEDGKFGKNTLDAVRDAQADRDKANQMVGPTNKEVSE
jgi:indole-3-glycerol phosphate synthase